jgi:Mce-associated membrane protein
MGSEPTDTSDSNDSSSAPARRASIAGAARRALRTRQIAETREALESVPDGGAVEDKAVQDRAVESRAVESRAVESQGLEKPAAVAEPDAEPEAIPATQTPTAAAVPMSDTVATPVEAAPARRPIGSALSRRRGVLVLAVLTGLAVAYVVVSAAWLARAKPSGDVQFANARDAVLVDAQRDIETINTLDYRKTDSGLDAWLEVSTGTQRDQVAQARTSIASQVAQQKAITSGQVLAAAVVALDDRSGTATVIATVEQNVSLGGKAPVKKRDRYAAEMSRTGGSWKISSITLVPV